MWHMGAAGDKLAFQGYAHAASQEHVLRVGLGIWTHYAVVSRMGYNAESNAFTSVPDLYVNGLQVTTGIEQVVGNLIWNTGNNIFFGNNVKNGTRPFMGDFDDFRFYDGPLSAQEVRDIYQGAPQVSAGADFTVASEQAALRGAASESEATPISIGLSAQTFWTLVSAPAGGEGARFETPEAESTRVTLPVEGEYVFRLTASNSAYSASDEVTVTRLAPPGSNQPPTVSLAAAAAVNLPAPLDLSAAVADPDSAPGTLRVAWSKASGPGGVYFDDASANATRATFLTAGVYVLRCTADDGLDSASADITVTASGTEDPFNVTNGLARHYPVNRAPLNKEVISGSTLMTVSKYVDGVLGYGLRSPGAKDYSDTSLALPEDGIINQPPTNITHLAFSFWMFHDTADTNVSADASLFNVNLTLGIYYRCQNASPGFRLFQQGPGGAYTLHTFPSPANPPQDCWTHVYACFDRAAGDELELYIDGAKQTRDSYIGKSSARVRGEGMQIGGMTETTGGPQGPITNSVSGGFYSRVFPGIIDEVRVYNRKLSEAEIACLATRPAWFNRGPLPEIAGAGELSGHVGQTLPLQAAAYDDGLPEGSTLACRWRVTEGDESGIAFGDVYAPSTSVTLLTAGTYAVQMEASDGERVAYSEVVTITVNPGGTVILLQ
ncbi:MAG: LamG domain-containing protein [Lentisphaerae bacterium]|nr:LamG domain-containing protein [Lentisphaerota bacterium]